jgi:hypothetical protein
LPAGQKSTDASEHWETLVAPFARRKLDDASMMEVVKPVAHDSHVLAASVATYFPAGQ